MKKLFFSLPPHVSLQIADRKSPARFLRFSSPIFFDKAQNLEKDKILKCSAGHLPQQILISDSKIFRLLRESDRNGSYSLRLRGQIRKVLYLPIELALMVYHFRKIKGFYKKNIYPNIDKTPPLRPLHKFDPPASKARHEAA